MAPLQSLDRVHPLAAQAVNALATVQQLPNLKVDGTAMPVVQWCRIGAYRIPSRIGFDLGVHSSGWLWTDIVDIAKCAPWATIEPALRKPIVQAALQPALDWISAVTGTPAGLRMERSPPTAHLETLSFRFAGEPGSAAPARQIVLACEPQGWAAFARCVAGAQTPLPNTEMRVPVRLRFPAPRLTLRDLSTLRFGDFICLQPKDALSKPSVHACVGSVPLFSCSLQDQAVVVDSIMSIIQPTSTPNEVTPTKRLNQLELDVSFQLGVVNLTVQALAQISPGYVFTTPTPINDGKVNILVDGQRMGTGKLIAVGDMIGIQVLSWS